MKQEPEMKQRGLRLPPNLDDWLDAQTKVRGFRSVQELILELIRKEKEKEKDRSSAEAVAA